MSVTPEQHIEVLKQVADLRVHVETLAGKLDVMNERLTNTNTALTSLNDTLREAATQTGANRKYIVGTFLSTVGVVITLLAFFLRL